MTKLASWYKYIQSIYNLYHHDNISFVVKIIYNVHIKNVHRAIFMSNLLEKKTYHWNFSHTTHIPSYFFPTHRGMTNVQRGNFSGISATET